MVHVDDELLKYGARIGATLRGLADWSEGMSRYGYRGYRYSVPNYWAIQNAKAAEAANEADSIMRIWDNIDNTRATVRRKMVEKYQVDF